MDNLEGEVADEEFHKYDFESHIGVSCFLRRKPVKRSPTPKRKLW